MNLELKKEMYNILKEKIREKKLSYKKLSEKMRISESGFNKKINGKYFFTQEEIFLLKRIIKKFWINTDIFLNKYIAMKEK